MYIGPAVKGCGPQYIGKDLAVCFRFFWPYCFRSLIVSDLSGFTAPADAPPLLIMTRVDHPNVAAGLVALFMEWKKAGANAELHMYGDGKGPYELMPQTGETTTETWSPQLIQWLKARGFVNRNSHLVYP